MEKRMNKLDEEYEKTLLEEIVKRDIEIMRLEKTRRVLLITNWVLIITSIITSIVVNVYMYTK